jgi:hypothetical protein
MKTEPIDTVKMTRQIRDRMYEETKDLGSEALLAYFRERSRASVEKLRRGRESERRNELTIR